MRHAILDRRRCGARRRNARRGRLRQLECERRRSSSAPSTTRRSGRPIPAARWPQAQDCRPRRDRAERGLVAGHDRRLATCRRLRRAVRAAVAARTSSRSWPSTSSARRRRPPTATARAFAAYAASSARALPAVHQVIVGNEPNLNLFWQPQFGTDGSDAAAGSYEALLAATYDALKSLPSPPEVIGGGLAPRGGDDATASRQTHSPTAFIRDLGAAYRASGRTRPLMDAFSIHVYGENPRIPPSLAHPHTTSIGIADYPKLVACSARRSTARAQAGSDLPIVYGEYGVETKRPAGQGVALHGPRGRAGDRRRRRRPPSTARRSSSRAGSRQSECSVSSTSTTRRASTGCRAVCATPTGRRNRASTPSVRPRRGPLAFGL